MLEQFESLSPVLQMLAGLAVLLLVAIASDLLVRRTLVAVAGLLASRSATRWDDELVNQRVLSRISHVLPAMVIERGIAYVPYLSPTVVDVIQNVALAIVVFTVTFAITSALAAGNRIYESTGLSRDRPLKGIVQVVQIVVWIIGAVLIVSELADKDPTVLLSGVGAMTAVVLLVFKDTILGLVASIQLSANDMVRVGDWIEMPAYDADGDVIEVALHTVKVQNWDKTITTIPTYKLIAESFRNWRGMSDAGGRRIKRSIYLDQQSIRFLNDDEISKLKRFALLREHFENKRRELEEAAAGLGDDAKELVNRRRLTNVGVFRAYVRYYLSLHPSVHTGLTLLVRQLDPGPQGLPIQVYCFTRSTEWLVYEDVQSDIFDHLLAILPEFGLSVYQQPAGSDLRQLLLSANNQET